MKIVISGAGCCVQDNIYTGVDVLHSAYAPYLHYGELTDVDQFEAQTGVRIEDAVNAMTGGQKPQKNLGGVCVVALVGAAQLLEGFGADVYFYKNVSTDSIGDFIMERIHQTPLQTSKITRKPGRSAATYALCDDQNKQGTRSFLNVAHVRDELAFQYEQLDDAFFQSDFLLLNCILWEPLLEKRLTDILRKAKEGGSINLLGTASDPRYRNTKQWILGEDNTAYPYIDVLMMNLTEAKGYAGTDSFKGMKQFFKSKGVKSFVVTDGRNPTYVYAGDDGPFNPFDGFVPVAEEIDLDKEKGVLPEGDGVGCGDNFDSGILASLAMQKSQGIFPYDLLDAVLLGNVAGGLTSCIRGGTFFEKYPGKKRDICMRYYPKYRKRIRKELGCDKARRDA